MPQVESLTVQILGDSSDLQTELESVAEMLDGLQQQLAEGAEGATDLGNAFSGLSSSLAPLQGFSGALSLISQQIQQIAGLPVTLNVQPALNALAQLMQAAQAAAAQLAAISMASIAGPTIGPWSPVPFPGGGRAQVQRAYAGGGLVAGPSGIDRVSAHLTAGEFVLNQEAVLKLGVNRLDQWNRGIGVGDAIVPDPRERLLALRMPGEESVSIPSRARSIPSSTSTTQQTMNHFGGIEIHVRETADVGELMQDLRRQGIGIRNRRG
ncbi:hypothetical protein SH661x_004000 [Planctomicrobium sp. SH661]|uniref:hypothetical protein n=1 Tax=Planctomicrobium sp. SH661 TaxID=3448124 RepID=UPI003F5B632B